MEEAWWGGGETYAELALEVLELLDVPPQLVEEPAQLVDTWRAVADVLGLEGEQVDVSMQNMKIGIVQALQR